MGEVKVKVKVQPDKGEAGIAQIGRDYINLEDMTKVTFKTASLTEFCQFLEKFGQDEMVTIYDHIKADAWPGETKDNRYEEPIASCQLVESNMLSLIQKQNGQKMGIDSFELFLRRTVDYCQNEVAMQTLTRIRDFAISKNLKVERKKDGQGNFAYSVSRSAGVDDYKPPNFIEFTVPLFEFMEETITVKLEFFFDFIPQDEGVKLYFTLEDLALEEAIKLARIAAIKAGVSELKGTKYMGARSVIEKDNSWQFKDNGLTLE